MIEIAYYVLITITVNITSGTMTTDRDYFTWKGAKSCKNSAIANESMKTDHIKIRSECFKIRK